MPAVRPRVALVFGDMASAGHLRDAVAAHVEIVYETAAADFDSGRLAGARATAALVNLDDCDWLDPVEARLDEAGIPVVFNDPEISRSLEGCAQARWLRHLTAKLSGSTDFDPPRPILEAAPPSPAPTEVEPAMQQPSVVVDGPSIAERPLSPAEIESMTADFVAEQEPPMAAIEVDDVTVETAPDAAGITSDVAAPADSAPAIALPSDVDDAPAAPAVESIDGPVESGQHPVQAGSGMQEPSDLDVDTEALSALIDARLAESDAHISSESPEVWRVVEGGTVSPVDSVHVAPEVHAVAGTAGADDAAKKPAPPADDSDVLGALPSLDDWQLVDPEAPVAQATVAASGKHPEPALAMDFAGLELVPMETAAAVERHSEPIERWMHVADHDKAGADKDKSPAGPNGGQE